MPSPPINNHYACQHSLQHHSRLQQQAPAVKKWKHAESGADQANKKVKPMTNDNADDDNDNPKVTRKGKKAARGKGKGTKRARYVAPAAMSLPTHII